MLKSLVAPKNFSSLCKEVLDGLRVYFDIALSNNLLYKNEAQAYLDAQVTLSANRLLQRGRDRRSKSPATQKPRKRSATFEDLEHKQSLSRKLSAGSNNAKVRSVSLRSTRGLQTRRSEPSASRGVQSDQESSGIVEDSPSKRIRLLNQIKHMRSCINAVPPVSDTVDMKPTSSNSRKVVSNSDSECSRKINEVSGELQRALNDAQCWQAVPVSELNESDPIPPCLIFGAPFLFRFLVKFPQMITESEVPDSRVKIILKHVSLFLDKYVSSRNDLFNVNVFL